MTDREQAIDYLIARTALEDLAGRYVRAIDRRDMELLKSVYHPDAHDEHGTAYVGDVPGFIAAQPALMANFGVTQHQIHSKSYQIEGHRAEGELYFTAYHRTLEPPRHMVVHGRYLDKYEKRDGEWKISLRKLVWDAFITTEVNEADDELLRSLGHIGAAEDDYSYACLDLMPRGG